MAKIVEKLQSSQGISFVYSRYVKAGILPLAIALERQGWTRVFSSPDARPVYTERDQKVSRQCAFCEKREDAHASIKDHVFKPACFIILTGDITITPNFSDSLSYATNWKKDDINAANGGQVKAILGSQITTEGLDLKCIRSIHILDPWYHLNRLEQIIGRGIRFCSHASLPPHLRNCLIYMYALTIGKIETPDLHAYRLSAEKAKAIGRVQRLLKISALDCNLNIAGLIVRGAPPRNIIDAEKRTLNNYIINEYDEDPEKQKKTINKWSSTCDYMENCLYECNPPVTEDDEKKDTTTYTFFDARKRLAEKEARVKELFSKADVAIPLSVIKEKIYGDLPWEIVSKAIVNILENPSFRIERDNLF
jgi:hypothetical protein